MVEIRLSDVLDAATSTPPLAHTKRILAQAARAGWGVLPILPVAELLVLSFCHFVIDKNFYKKVGFLHCKFVPCKIQAKRAKGTLPAPHHELQ
jgi:hypothetical protein